MNVFWKFLTEFVVKDKKTRSILAKGSRKGELYALDPNCVNGEVYQALVLVRSNKASDYVGHQ